MITDLSDSIERAPDYEARLGVRLEGVYAAIVEDGDDQGFRVMVRGEIRATAKSSRLQENVEVVLAVYDERSRVLAKGGHYFFEDSFFDFDVFEIDVFDVPVRPSRLKLFPKPA